MINDELSAKSLTEEKSLWAIYIKARRIPFNPFNLWSTILVTILVITQYCVLEIPIDEKLKIVRDFSSMAIGIAVSVLGFILAGFTIFATISQPEMFVAMSKHRHEISGLSYLKNNFFIFMRVFIYYLIYTVFCLFIITFGIQGGIFHKLSTLSPISCHINEWLIGFSYVFLHAGLFFLLTQLKSFIFNVYHSVMTAIRWKALQ
ncbi:MULTISPECIES: hypothetical protein [unclassified Pseudomonas]|uniref:hypothetical protein n=1 Tax=unclassified Pseudomonas TaxID=196821 RepID=UPI00159FCE7B|nr:MULTISPECIES: hypothetical protein [unclassified Pseudomonas]NWC95040.1 hypothetical protein [Pseudomonas sp. IPO3779]NWD18300.1 hypothetical protein [Pseudomonas sp. IPO3778]